MPESNYKITVNPVKTSALLIARHVGNGFSASGRLRFESVLFGLQKYRGSVRDEGRKVLTVSYNH